MSGDGAGRGARGGSHGESESRGHAAPSPEATGAPTEFVVRVGTGADVHVYEWACPTPRGVVHFSHGSGEHAMRYDWYARLLVAAGYAVVAHDHLAHGQTALAGNGLAVLPPSENRAALDAYEDIVAWVRDRYPRLPLILQAHSWGSLLAQQLLARDSRFFSACILTGTTLALPGFINPGRLNRAFEPDPTGYLWLSRNPETRKGFADDPLCFDIASMPVWSKLGGLQLAHVPPRAASGKIDDLPMLIVAGSEDPIGFGERGPRALARMYRKRSKLSDVTLRIYAGARHEPLYEINRDDVVADILAWLDARIPLPR